MTKAEIINKATRTFHKVGFQLKKHSPEILVAAGVIGTVASTVLACKATTKLSGILDEAKTNIDTIHSCVDNPVFEEQYTKEDSKKDLTIVYAQTGLKLAKLYAPAVAIGAASIGCILTSHNIITKRNVALAAAYATVDNSFKDYRKRVVERFGKDLDRELKFNIKAKEVEETVVGEDGKETTVKKTVQVADVNLSGHSDYARFFDETCTGWTRDPEYNLMFLKQQERYANDLLKSRGHLYLNEVYDMLGMKRSQAGQMVGWVYDPENPDVDSYVDFGIYEMCGREIYDEPKRNFVNGLEKSILLDFNVDGNILKLMS